MGPFNRLRLLGKAISRGSIPLLDFLESNLDISDTPEMIL
jgi:hypothetical protein